MENTTKSRRRKAAKRLQRAVVGGKVTMTQVAEKTSRCTRTVSEWVSGLRLPPSTVLSTLDDIMKDMA